MKILTRATDEARTVIATFGKSTYKEPYISRSSIDSLVLVKDAMPDLWRNVDETASEIMSGAVIMSG